MLQGDDMKVMENDTDWQFVTIGDQVNLPFVMFHVRDIDIVIILTCDVSRNLCS